MTWTSMQSMNRWGSHFPAAICLVLAAASACADTGFSASTSLLTARFVALFAGTRGAPPAAQ
jgi:hypothetical protein